MPVVLTWDYCTTSKWASIISYYYFFSDASGMTLFLTPKLRSFNLGYLITGQEKLALEPGQQAVIRTSSCPGSCTVEDMSDIIYIKTAHVHMHYLGKLSLKY